MAGFTDRSADRWQDPDRYLRELESDRVTAGSSARRAQELRQLERHFDAFDFFPGARTLGRGGFGTVREARLDSALVAVKEIAATAADGLFSVDERRMIENEALLLRALHASPFVLQIRAIAWGAGRVRIAFELATRGALASLLRHAAARTVELPLSLRLAWLLDVAHALAHIHARGLVHRDVKAENVLLFADPRLRAKLGDFGLAKAHDGGRTVAGTEAFMAPEVMARRGAALPSDVYSWAMLAVQLLTLRAPTTSRSAIEQVQAACAAARAPGLVSELLLQCCREDPQQRPTVEAVVEELALALASCGGDPREERAHPDFAATSALDGWLAESQAAAPRFALAPPLRPAPASGRTSTPAAASASMASSASASASASAASTSASASAASMSASWRSSSARSDPWAGWLPEDRATVEPLVTWLRERLGMSLALAVNTAGPLLEGRAGTVERLRQMVAEQPGFLQRCGVEASLAADIAAHLRSTSSVRHSTSSSASSSASERRQLEEERHRLEEERRRLEAAQREAARLRAQEAARLREQEAARLRAQEAIVVTSRIRRVCCVDSSRRI